MSNTIKISKKVVRQLLKRCLGAAPLALVQSSDSMVGRVRVTKKLSKKKRSITTYDLFYTLSSQEVHVKVEYDTPDSLQCFECRFDDLPAFLMAYDVKSVRVPGRKVRPTKSSD